VVMCGVHYRTIICASFSFSNRLWALVSFFDKICYKICLAFLIAADVCRRRVIYFNFF